MPDPAPSSSIAAMALTTTVRQGMGSDTPLRIPAFRRTRAPRGRPDTHGSGPAPDAVRQWARRGADASVAGHRDGRAGPRPRRRERWEP
ncbi:hypothetical protein GCM10023335_82600 [Streptomyces siamensis]|uniref:Uncharacterized protein n=1 Tax=Streptomyces siamensis TaxID=1274986 RepID=A0ABP9JLU7_9ACTN